MSRTFSLRRLLTVITWICILCAFVANFPHASLVLAIFAAHLAPTFVAWNTLLHFSRRPGALQPIMVFGAFAGFLYTPAFMSFPFSVTGNSGLDWLSIALPPALGVLILGGVELWNDIRARRAQR